MSKVSSRTGGAAAVVLLFSVALPAHAYLDPVTGLFIAQGIGAAVLGVIAGVKRLRDRVIGFFFRRNKAPAGNDSA